MSIHARGPWEPVRFKRRWVPEWLFRLVYRQLRVPPWVWPVRQILTRKP